MEAKDIKILLVDDFELVRVMLRAGLKTLGFENVDEADDGGPALAKISAAHAAGAPYSIIFCDWVMPDVPGIEVVQKCRADPRFKDLCIIMVTAESEPASVMTAIRAGASDYIVKPFSPDLLEKKISKIMAKIAAQQNKSAA